jgi:hypothetical protein
MPAPQQGKLPSMWLAARHFQGMSDYTQSCKFIDYILKGDIIKYKSFAAWLVAKLVFAELRPEPSFLT